MEKNDLTDEIIKDINYYSYLIQYRGDIEEEFNKYPLLKIKKINDKYAILFVPEDQLNIIDQGFDFKTIEHINIPQMFTLEEISPVEASNVNLLQLNLPLNLTGKGVNVAVIDTGIDYLNEEFMDSNGQTRIDLIWDQNISSTSEGNIEVPFGTIYKKEDIQKAINEFKSGKDPYAIVPSKDEIGHGTKMSGLIGAAGKNPDLKGVAPQCNLIEIKLIEDYTYKNKYRADVPVYNITTIFSAVEFLYRYALSSKIPLVIYFPLGSNAGNHMGNGFLDQYIDNICMNPEIAVVTGTGNERDSKTHTSGVLLKEEKAKVIDMEVSPEEKDLWIEIWVDMPNIFSLDIVSPSGESTGIINALINDTQYQTFIFEKTSVKVNYYIPEAISGDELIRIRFFDLQPGIWKLRLTGNLILDGRFNVWMSQSGLKAKDTGFSLVDTYGTITNPANSKITVTIAAYNQNNDNLVNYSGVAFENNYVNGIDVAAGGVNALTIAPNNKIELANGTSVAAAIGAGACALIFQWGIVEGNYPHMYAQALKTFLIRGTDMRSGDIYPNPSLGYGKLNIYKIFKNII